MTSAGLRVGARVALGERLVEVVSIGSTSEVVVRNVANGDTQTVGAGELSDVPDQSSPAAVDLATEDAEDLARACRWRDAMNAIESEEASIHQVARDMGCSIRTVRRHLREHRLQSGVGAHLPKKTGPAPGACLLRPEVEEIIDQCIESLWLDDQQRDMKAVSEEVAYRCHAAGLRSPAAASVRRRIHMVDERLALARRRGKKAARDRFDPAAKPFVVERALDLLQIDHALVDLILVDSDSRAPIGRPWLTIGIDCATRVIGGIYLSLDYPSSVAVASCVSHAFLPKDKWLRDREVKSTWPVFGHWKTLHFDNAREFCSDAVKAGCSAHQIILEYRPVKTPHYGAHIERLIGTLSRKIKILKGATFSSIEARGTYDSEGKAALTLREFERWLIHEIEIYHRTPHRGLEGSTPLQAWDASLEAAGCVPVAGSIAMQRQLFLDFLPFEKRKVTRGGIELFTGKYWTGALSHYIGAKAPIVVRYDPRDMSRVYAKVPDGDYVDVPYADVRLRSSSLGEIRRAAKELRQRNHDPRNGVLRQQAIVEQRDLERAAAQRSKRARRALEARSLAQRSVDLLAPSSAENLQTEVATAQSDEAVDSMAVTELLVEEWY